MAFTCISSFVNAQRCQAMTCSISAKQGEPTPLPTQAGGVALLLGRGENVAVRRAALRNCCTERCDLDTHAIDGFGLGSDQHQRAVGEGRLSGLVAVGGFDLVPLRVGAKSDTRSPAPT